MITYVLAGQPQDAIKQDEFLPHRSFRDCLNRTRQDNWLNDEARIILAEGCMPPNIGGVLVLEDVMKCDNIVILPGRPERKLFALLRGKSREATEWRTRIQKKCPVDWQGMCDYLGPRIGQCAINLTESFSESMQVRSSQYESRMKIGKPAWVIHMSPDARVDRVVPKGLYVGRYGRLYKICSGVVQRYYRSHQSGSDGWERICQITRTR